jgi:DNA-binding CsgD family transcriptional regulator
VLALLSIRDDRTDQLLASLHGLLTGPMAARLRLGGLGAEELRELCTALGTGSLSPRAAQRLHEHTGGNPLHARALLEEIPAAVLHHNAGPLPAPRSFALLVLARLAGCPPEAENLVVAASVLGISCPLSLASRLGKVADPLEALEQAAAAHLLRDHPTAIERLVTFPHPLVRAAVYHDLGPARRAGLHAGAAQLVENEPVALRHKVAAACGSDPQLAAELAALAGRQAAAGSWTAAADNLLAAATLAATQAERKRSVLTAMDYLRMGGNEAEASTLADELAALAEGAPQGHGQARLTPASRDAGTGKLLADACLQDQPGSQPKPPASHRTPPKRMAGPRTPLTRQELAVARLVADGHTNRETAEALVVSVKTIEYHLANTYAKLGVTSRTQLALALRQDPGNPWGAERGTLLS